MYIFSQASTDIALFKTPSNANVPDTLIAESQTLPCEQIQSSIPNKLITPMLKFTVPLRSMFEICAGYTRLILNLYLSIHLSCVRCVFFLS